MEIMTDRDRIFRAFFIGMPWIINGLLLGAFVWLNFASLPATWLLPILPGVVFFTISKYNEYFYILWLITWIINGLLLGAFVWFNPALLPVTWLLPLAILPAFVLCAILIVLSVLLAILDHFYPFYDRLEWIEKRIHAIITVLILPFLGFSFVCGLFTAWPIALASLVFPASFFINTAFLASYFGNETRAPLNYSKTPMFLFGIVGIVLGGLLFTNPTRLPASWLLPLALLPTPILVLTLFATAFYQGRGLIELYNPNTLIQDSLFLLIDLFQGISLACGLLSAWPAAVASIVSLVFPVSLLFIPEKIPEKNTTLSSHVPSELGDNKKKSYFYELVERNAKRLEHETPQDYDVDTTSRPSFTSN